MTSSSLYVVAICILPVLFLYHFVFRRRERLPPGPPGVPLLGNLFDLPTDHPWLSYAKWTKTYGDVIHLRVLGGSLVLLGSARAAEDLLEDRSLIYSDRPRFPMIAELMGWDWAVQFMSYGPKFHRYRKPLLRNLGSQAIEKYRPVIRHETHQLLSKLLAEPDHFLHHIQRTGACIMMSILYGHDDGPIRDAYIAAAEEATESLVVAGNLGGYLVDHIPLLRFWPEWAIPGGGFKRQARVWRKLATDMIEVPFVDVKQRLASGSASASLIADMLEQEHPGHSLLETDHLIKATGGVIYLGGADTQLSALWSFMLAMALYPEAQRKAQSEIDAVIGNDRLPDFMDRASLPYMELILKEVLRWNPVVPLGVLHRLMSEDKYKDYRIPAGSIVVPNIWGILHDESDYPEPLTFSPERYSKDVGGGETKDPRTACFGFGRRICPGRAFADATLWFMFTSIVAAFEIGKPYDEAGTEIKSPGLYTTGLVTRPIPFSCTITPRGSALVQRYVDTL